MGVLPLMVVSKVPLTQQAEEFILGMLVTLFNRLFAVNNLTD